MLSFGIMQGRLTPSNGNGIQFFPFGNWEKEFEECLRLKLDEIEWIFDYDMYEENPLWSINGVYHIKQVMNATGIKVRSVCFDYFMRRPFFKYNTLAIYKENIEFIKRILEGMNNINAVRNLP